jgi:hypothetical protein
MSLGGIQSDLRSLYNRLSNLVKNVAIDVERFGCAGELEEFHPSTYPRRVLEWHKVIEKMIGEVEEEREERERVRKRQRE